jgi:hypothetical protein
VVLQHLKSPKQPTWQGVLPKGISIPLYTLRQRFITRSAFPVSPNATASMQDDFGRVLPQTCADLYDNASVASNAQCYLTTIWRRLALPASSRHQKVDSQHPKGTSAFEPGHLPGLQRNQAARWVGLRRTEQKEISPSFLGLAVFSP